MFSRGAVVLLQFDDGGVGKVALEVQDDLDIRAPEGVDGIVDDNAPGDVVAEIRDGQVVDLAGIMLIGDAAIWLLVTKDPSRSFLATLQAAKGTVSSRPFSAAAGWTAAQS